MRIVIVAALAPVFACSYEDDTFTVDPMEKQLDTRPPSLRA